MEKKQASWPLRLKLPEDFPNIGKFTDPIVWDKAKKPLKMYFKDEELKEEPEEGTVKDAEYYKRKRNQRRRYRKKNLLILEDSTERIPNKPFTGVKFTAQTVNLGITELDANMGYNSNNEEVPFKYALLQFVKNEDDTEINVIPVGDMFAFRKDHGVGDELLEEIDAKFEMEKSRLEVKMKKYKEIMTSLDMAEKAKKLREGEDDDDYIGGFESSTLFGTVGKGKSKKTKKELDIQHIDENGTDLDAMKEHDWCQGDYSSRYADDEEDNVTGYEQQQLNQMEDNEFSSSVRFDEEALAAIEEELAKEEESDKKRGVATPPNPLEMDEEGIVTDTVLMSAQEARIMFSTAGKSNNNNGSNSNTLDSSSSNNDNNNVAMEVVDNNNTAVVSVPVKSAMKRPRDNKETDITAGDNSAKGNGGGVSFADTTKGSSPDKSNATKKSKSNNNNNNSSNNYELSEEGVKQFIINRGGRVSIKEMLEFYKPAIKSLSKQSGDKESGKKKFIDIVDRVTVTIEDPLLGNALTLKKQ